MANEKYAIRRLIRNRNTGRVDIKFIDAVTNEEVNNLDGYQIHESKGFMSLDDLGINPSKISTQEDQTVPQQIIREQVAPSGGLDAQRDPSFAGAANRNMSNNFGYFDKPAAMGLASFVPGPIGMAAKAANAGININNAAAAQEARKTIGLPEKGFMSTIGGAFADNKGYIDDVKYADDSGRVRTTPVSFEAEDPSGRTALTPNEARNRALTNPDNFLGVATKDETKEARSNAGNKSGGMFGGLKGVMANIADNIFGPLSPSKTSNVTPTKTEPMDRGVRDTSSFAPTSPNKDMSVKDQYGSYGAGKAQDYSGVGKSQSEKSGQAEAASKSEGKGLY